MRRTFVSRAGGVLSADIAVPDHEREVAFYSKVLTTGDRPLWQEDLMNNQGTPIIGLGARTPEYEQLPLQWMPHFQVADIAASVASAIEMGGQELMHGKTEQGESQWALVADPNGTVAGLIPVVDDDAYNVSPSDRVGCISWLSLHVENADSIRDFYSKVLGWDATVLDSGGEAAATTGYEMKIDEEYSVADILQSQGAVAEIPPVWLIHLPVGDFAASLKQVADGGGHVVAEFPEQYAIIRDPVGVYFAIKAG